MKRSNLKRSALLALACTSLLGGAALADDGEDLARDFGATVERLQSALSETLYGFKAPLPASAGPTTGAVRTTTQPAWAQALVARGLKVEYLTRNAADATDMMAFYPAANPTHLITCVEGGRTVINSATGKLNPSIQSISLANGEVKTLVRGMTSCDGIRTTPWGTVLATEEASDGGAYELLNPLSLADVTIVNRATGQTSAPDRVIRRLALPTMAWEGIAVLANGVVYAGDELRPGTGGADRDGGAIFKFVPSVAWAGGPAITALSQSPFAAGNTFAMQVACVNNTQQVGQGCEVGNAAWVPVLATTARTDARTALATGYYRPEDLHQDLKYADAANPAAVRFCWTDTGNEDALNYAEVMCAVDSKPLVATAVERSVWVSRFIEGDPDFNSFDNLDFQPRTGNLYVIEDHPNGDVFACLPDGTDRNLDTDGCAKMLSVVDSSAEPTGFIFDASGKVAYVSIQHSDDALMPKVDDYGTDDVLRITGFKVGDRRRD